MGDSPLIVFRYSARLGLRLVEESLRLGERYAA